MTFCALLIMETHLFLLCWIYQLLLIQQTIPRFEHVFGIHDTALRWFSSYLTNKTQTATENNCSSGPVTISCGVPQGSVVSFCRPHLSLMLWTATLSFIILLLMTLNCKNLSVHNMLINSFNPYKSASITLSRG